MTISVVLPAYQEAENLKNILPNIHEVLKDVEHEVLVIDTMEPMDNTEEVCRENHTRYVPRTGGNLYGDAIRTGFASATGKYTVIMDADGSHDPREILNFLEVMEQGKTDLVIGSRYCKGGYTDNNFILRFMSWALNVTYRVLFGLKVKDVSDSFRMYKTEQIQQLQFECDNFDIVEEILIKLSYSFDPYVIRELPISFNKRVAGESKRDLVKFIISYIKTIRKLMRIKGTIKGR
jgi:dolichol-phosphate mannosyltransferase